MPRGGHKGVPRLKPVGRRSVPTAAQDAAAVVELREGARAIAERSRATERAELPELAEEIRAHREAAQARPLQAETLVEHELVGIGGVLLF